MEEEVRSRHISAAWAFGVQIWILFPLSYTTGLYQPLAHLWQVYARGARNHLGAHCPPYPGLPQEVVCSIVP